jgi:hypothetical protein
MSKEIKTKGMSDKMVMNEGMKAVEMHVEGYTDNKGVHQSLWVPDGYALVIDANVEGKGKPMVWPEQDHHYEGRAAPDGASITKPLSYEDDERMRESARGVSDIARYEPVSSGGNVGIGTTLEKQPGVPYWAGRIGVVVEALEKRVAGLTSRLYSVLHIDVPELDAVAPSPLDVAPLADQLYILHNRLFNLVVKLGDVEQRLEI